MHLYQVNNSFLVNARNCLHWWSSLKWNPGECSRLWSRQLKRPDGRECWAGNAVLQVVEQTQIPLSVSTKRTELNWTGQISSVRAMWTRLYSASLGSILQLLYTGWFVSSDPPNIVQITVDREFAHITLKLHSKTNFLCMLPWLGHPLTAL